MAATSAGRSASTNTKGRPPKTTTAEIVDAAHKLFSANGFKATTLAAVGAQVGLTDAGVLHHFASKDALVKAVLERELEQQIQGMNDLVDLGGLAALRRLAAWGSVVEQTPELASLQIVMSAEGISETSMFHDYVVERYAHVHQLVVDLIEEGVANGDFRPDADADWEASALVAYLDGIRLQWFYSGRQLRLGAAVERYVNLLIDRLMP